MNRRYAFLFVAAALMAAPVNASSKIEKPLKGLELISNRLTTMRSGAGMPTKPVTEFPELTPVATETVSSNTRRIYGAKQRSLAEIRHDLNKKRFEILRSTLNALQTVDDAKAWMNAFITATTVSFRTIKPFEKRSPDQRRDFASEAIQLITDAMLLDTIQNLPSTELSKLSEAFNKAHNILSQMRTEGEMDLNDDTLILVGTPATEEGGEE